MRKSTVAGKKRKEKPVDIFLAVRSNDPQDYMYTLLQMFYRGAHLNLLGLAEVRNKETGEVTLAITGSTFKEDGKGTAMPIALVLQDVDATKYEVADGKGGWFGSGEETAVKVKDYEQPSDEA